MSINDDDIADDLLEIDQLIDREIYALFGLTDDEISLVEGALR